LFQPEGPLLAKKQFMKAITLTIGILTLVTLKAFSQNKTGMDKSKNY